MAKLKVSVHTTVSLNLYCLLRFVYSIGGYMGVQGVRTPPLFPEKRPTKGSGPPLFSRSKNIFQSKTTTIEVALPYSPEVACWNGVIIRTFNTNVEKPIWKKWLTKYFCMLGVHCNSPLLIHVHTVCHTLWPFKKKKKNREARKIKCGTCFGEVFTAPNQIRLLRLCWW